MENDKRMVMKTDFSIASEMKNLAIVRQKVDDVASECGFTEADIYQMKVAVSEAVANAIEHGSPNGPKSIVHVYIECDSQRTVIEVLDQGVFKARLPVANGRPSHRGRGIFLMTALMDEVNISEKPNGTLVRLVKLKEPAIEQKQAMR